MFNNLVTISVDSEDYLYGLISINGSDSQRSRAAAPIGEPDVLSVKHSVQNTGNKAISRHLVRVDTTLSDTNDDGSVSEVTVSAYVVLVAPHRIATSLDVELAYEKLVAFMSATEAGYTDTNLTRLLNGEP